MYACTAQVVQIGKKKCDISILLMYFISFRFVALDSDFEYSTQAYTGYEPTSMRAIRARYHPYSQTRGRVDQLRRLGHSVDKVEFIVMGGTFMSLDASYKVGRLGRLVLMQWY